MNANDTPTGPLPESADAVPVLLAFFRALSDPARPRIAGLIAGEAMTAVEAGARSGLGTAVVRRHLRLLERADLVEAEGTGGAARYRLRHERLRRLSAALLESPSARARADATDDRGHVLAAFFRVGRLTRIPTGERRRLIVLEEFARRFERGRTYSEREVNAIIKAAYDDYATIRRWLVDYVFLNRHAGVYWVGEGRQADPSPSGE